MYKHVSFLSQFYLWNLKTAFGPGGFLLFSFEFPFSGEVKLFTEGKRSSFTFLI